MEWQAKKRFKIITRQGRDVMLQKVVSRWVPWNTILSAVVCGPCFADLDTFIVRRMCQIIRGRNPPCNAEDYLCAGHLIIEARFRGY